MKSESTLRRELRKAEQALAEEVVADGLLAGADTAAERRRAELYGTQQALAWALGMDAMAPVRAAVGGAK